MLFYKSNLFARLLFLALSMCLAVSVSTCDIHDIPLGREPGSVAEQVDEDADTDRNPDMENVAGYAEGKSGIGGSGAEGNDSTGGRDIPHDKEYRDAGYQPDPESGAIDASDQFEVCGSTFCLPGSVCCASCGFCIPEGELCPEECFEWIEPTDFCYQIECGAPPGRAMTTCPIGTFGGLMCTKTDDGTCVWQFMPCVSPIKNQLCGESVGSMCDSFEYCDAPDCGEGTKTGFCRLRPVECQREQDPVCGCDGRDYENPCLAQAAGTNVAYAGTCR